MQIQVETAHGYLRVVASGPFSFEDARRNFLELLDVVARQKIGSILYDGRQVTGEPNVVERLLYGEFVARAVAEFCERTRFPAPQFAYVLTPPVLDHSRSGEDKAVRAGMNVRAFDNEAAALRWLGQHPYAFPAHGRAHYVITGQVARLQIEGPWNEELLVEPLASLRKSLEHIQPPGWMLMVVVRKSALCSPAALKAIRDAAAANSARLATAWVLPAGIEGREVMARAVEDAYAPAAMPLRIMEDEPEAERWLNGVLSASGG